MQIPRSCILLCVAALVASGCADAPASPDVASDVELDTSNPGVLEGVVTDDEQLPIAGATVALVDAGRNTITAADGRYRLGHLEPGEYDVAVQAIGFLSIGRKAIVVADEPATLDFVLQAAAKQQGFVRLDVQDGFITCSVGPNSNHVNPLCRSTFEDKSKLFIEIDPALGFKEVVAELDWTPGTAFTAKRLQMGLCTPQEPSATEEDCTRFDGVNSRNPIRMASGPPPVVMRETQLPLEETTQFEIQVLDAGVYYNGSAPAGSDVSATFQQDFTLYISICYVRQCQTSYSALPPD